MNSKQNYNQFSYEYNDVVKDPLSQLSPETLLSAILLVDHNCPGTIEFIVRLCALAIEGFVFKTKTSNPQRSIEVQQEFGELMKDIDDEIRTLRKRQERIDSLYERYQ